MNTYQATDDDLPDFDSVPSQEEQRRRAASIGQRASIAVQLHYPQAGLSEQEKQAARAMRNGAPTAAQLDEQANRKKYIRWPKRAQMWDWLRALSAVDVALSTFERQFVSQMLDKFERWRDRTKWITEKQYQFAKDIAARKLKEGSSGQ